MDDSETMSLVDAIEYIRNDEAHAAALAELREVREVLTQLAEWPWPTGEPCWCRLEGEHSDACQRARELMKRLQLKEN
jgi:hypothetical protein